jgi:3-deoxy-D-manno-octulosonate 8-phosphate phosphatase (KDO 8-P phosphatase)
MDVDGVLTDGRIVLTEGGDELKFFHSHDGLAINLAKRAGLKIAFVTAESSQIALARGKKLGVDDVCIGVRRKGEALEDLLAKHGLSAQECAYIGDDLLDIPALQRAGLAVAVANAVPEVKRLAHLVTRAAGGQGAVREAVEWILGAQGRWRQTVVEYITDHGGL